MQPRKCYSITTRIKYHQTFMSFKALTNNKKKEEAFLHYRLNYDFFMSGYCEGSFFLYVFVHVTILFCFVFVVNRERMFLRLLSCC